MDTKLRFSNRVEDYIKYRPGYPPQLLELLRSEFGLRPTWTIADVGSGTGILTELLLQNGNHVYAIEPNREMRQAAERLLAAFPRFHSVNGAAEDTTLESGSVELITAGQAFHWFDGNKTRAEFIRILKPGGCVVLVWNDRKTASTPFLLAYDKLLRARGLDYELVNHRNVDDLRLRRFFGAGGFREAVFANVQQFDWDGLRGRASSSSYVPPEGHPKYAVFMDGLAELYRTHQEHGLVSFEYDTRMYFGRLT